MIREGGTRQAGTRQAGHGEKEEEHSRTVRNRHTYRTAGRPMFKFVFTRTRCGTPQQGLSSSKMILITSDCDAMRTHEHQMALIT